MGKLRAICSDIDGTLLNADRELSQRTIATVKRLPKHLPVILASSRMLRALRHLQAQLDILNQPLICYNGGYVLLYSKHEVGEKPKVLLSVQIPSAICEKIVDLAGPSVHVSLFQDDVWYAPLVEDRWTTREAHNTKTTPVFSDPKQVLEEWNGRAAGAHKVMCMGEEAEVDRLWSLLQTSFAEDLHLYRSKPTYIEIAPKSISKATALDALLKHEYDFGMDAVMAFGDNYNDVELLANVGIGVAVGNAQKEAIAAAKETTAGSKEDGVALAIEKHMTLI